jgi:hypothetical protein
MAWNVARNQAVLVTSTVGREPLKFVPKAMVRVVPLLPLNRIVRCVPIWTLDGFGQVRFAVAVHSRLIPASQSKLGEAPSVRRRRRSASAGSS